MACGAFWENLFVSYLLNMSDTISISVSAAAIFSADEGWGRPPKRKDILLVWGFELFRYEGNLRSR